MPRPKKKPVYDAERIMKELTVAVVESHEENTRKIIRRIAYSNIQLHNKKQEMLVLYSILFARC